MNDLGRRENGGADWLMYGVEHNCHVAKMSSRGLLEQFIAFKPNATAHLDIGYKNILVV
jgi:hypothetical protein